MTNFKLIATTTFGLEAVVVRELEKLGMENIQTSDGRIDFTGDTKAIAKANLWLRSADRVMINFGEFEALSFEDLFQGVKALPWGDLLEKDAKFIVTGKSVRSQLFSVSDCQAITKKAIVEKLKEKYDEEWFQETGTEYKIQVGILKDKVTIAIDTTGSGLNKRGYRESAVTAPLKETLAHALIELSYWNKNRILADTMCGSGTIPIEAAMMAKNIAPGLTRNFQAENWSFIPASIWQEVRREAYTMVNTEPIAQIYGSDIDPDAITQAKINAELAGVDDVITFEVHGAADFKALGEYGVLISNPPYGARIGNFDEIKTLYTGFRRFMDENKTWSMYILTTDEEIEEYMKRRAAKKRKLYNGNIKTDYYQFVGPRPPK
ncbi:MAG: class I SAM-dependent RNA methyltransferase [Defluviitaleaceae bacterium]|nr:class I SAM-dependent RNA methyltransferase [Defluviitaleaceae bacterium]